MAADSQAAFSADQVIVAAYEGLLGRGPDAEGRENYARLLRAGVPLAEVLRGLCRIAGIRLRAGSNA